MGWLKMYEDKKAYSIFQNVAFMIRNAWNVSHVLPLAVICSAIVTGIISIIDAYLPKMVVAVVEEQKSVFDTAILIGVCTIVLMILLVLQIVFEYVMQGKKVLVRTELSAQLNRKRMTTDYENLYKAEFNQICDKADSTTDSSESACESIYQTFQTLLTNVIVFIFFLLVLTNANVVILALVTVTTLVSYFYNKRIERNIYESRAEYDLLSSKLRYIQMKSGDTAYTKDIQIFGMKEWLSDLYHTYTDACIRFQHTNEKKRLAGDLLGVAFDFLRNGAAYVFLIFMVWDGKIGVADFVLYFAAVGNFTQHLLGLFKTGEGLYQQSNEISYLRCALDYPDASQKKDTKKLIIGDNGVELELKDVYYRYPEAEKDTLQGINLKIHSRENLAVIGLNGAGKTTLVKVICGFLKPTSGKVLLNGVDISEYDILEYQKLFSTLFQDFSVLPNTIAENIAQTDITQVDWEHLTNCAELAGIREKIESMTRGYYTPLTKQISDEGVDLSGGQMQALMLARALYKNGPIIILDEPTAALDSITECKLYEKYGRLTQDKMSVFISHRLASTRFCDRIIMVEYGQIIEEGTHETLLQKHGRYAEVYAIQSQYYKEGAGEHEEDR